VLPPAFASLHGTDAVKLSRFFGLILRRLRRLPLYIGVTRARVRWFTWGTSATSALSVPVLVGGVFLPHAKPDEAGALGMSDEALFVSAVA
jgi:hypothetical protein